MSMVSNGIPRIGDVLIAMDCAGHGGVTPHRRELDNCTPQRRRSCHCPTRRGRIHRRTTIQKLLTRGRPWGHGKCRHREPRPQQAQAAWCFLRTWPTCVNGCARGREGRFRRVSTVTQELQKDAGQLCELLERVDQLSRPNICLYDRVKGSAARLKAVAAQIEAAGILSGHSCVCQ
jgi:hypothetical protein